MASLSFGNAKAGKSETKHLPFGKAKAGKSETDIKCDFSNPEKPLCKIVVNGKTKRLLVCPQSSFGFDTFLEKLNGWRKGPKDNSLFFDTQLNRHIKTNFGHLICGEKSDNQLLCYFLERKFLADCYHYGI